MVGLSIETLVYVYVHVCIVVIWYPGDHVTNYILGKLAGRVQKVAHYMIRKLGSGRAVKAGDRVALVFRPDEAPAFVSAFYGCINAAVIPVCIEPPLTKEVCFHVCCVCVCVYILWMYMYHNYANTMAITYSFLLHIWSSFTFW